MDVLFIDVIFFLFSLLLVVMCFCICSILEKINRRKWEACFLLSFAYFLFPPCN